MKKNYIQNSKTSTSKWIFRIAFLLFISVNFQNVNAQCSPDVSAPLPDNPSLPDITHECSVLLIRPTAYDVCENKTVSGTVINNKLIYTAGTYTVTWTYTDGSGNTSSQTQKVIVTPLSAPVISANGPVTFCQGDSVTLTSSSSTGNVLKNTAGTTYATNFIKVKTASTYTLTLTSGGCTSQAIQKITVNTTAPITPIIIPRSATTFCSGLNVILKSSSSTGNVWTGGSTIDSLKVFTSGTYSVTVTNGCGSATSLGTTIIAKPLTASITVTGSTTICSGTSVILISNSQTGNTWTGGTTKDSLTVKPTTPKTYTLTLSNGCGSTTKATKTITTIPLPAKPTLAPITGCSNATTIPLSGGSPAGGTYSGNGVLGNSYVPLIGNLLGGGLGINFVTYTITDSITGCSNSATTFLMLDTTSTCGATTGIEENTSSMEAVLYPNPTNGLLNITIKNANFNQLLISIVDVLGNEIFSSTDKQSTGNYYKQINLESLAKGIYYIRLNTGVDVATKKLIIQ